MYRGGLANCRETSAQSTGNGASGKELLQRWSERLAESRSGGSDGVSGAESPQSPWITTPCAQGAALDNLGQASSTR